jgi:hypothetical protein
MRHPDFFSKTEDERIFFNDSFNNSRVFIFFKGKLTGKSWYFNSSIIGNRAWNAQDLLEKESRVISKEELKSVLKSKFYFIPRKQSLLYEE